MSSYVKLITSSPIVFKQTRFSPLVLKYPDEISKSGAKPKYDWNPHPYVRAPHSSFKKNAGFAITTYSPGSNKYSVKLTLIPSVKASPPRG